MDIKEIAKRVSKRIYVEDGLLLSKFISEKFAEALIAEVAKQNEPVCEWVKADNGNYLVQKWAKGYVAMQGYKLYTLPPTAEQIAKAEQRVSEACAAYITSERYMVLNPGESISPEQHIQHLKIHNIYQAKCLRTGEWRKFVKEV